LDVKIGMTEVRLGLIPGWGGTQRLPRLIPQALAAEMLFTAEPIDAKEAYRIGLVNKVVPRAELINEVSYLANRIAANSPLAVEKVKEAMNRGLNMSLEDGLELENSFEAWIMRTQDYLEGITAFQAKGTPNFQRK
jgi:enoyl-CoA hydratase/carnithine racemase